MEYGYIREYAKALNNLNALTENDEPWENDWIQTGSIVEIQVGEEKNIVLITKVFYIDKSARFVGFSISKKDKSRFIVDDNIIYLGDDSTVKILYQDINAYIEQEIGS